MVSTFSGLEVAKRALNTQQAALYTTSHNISNANTEGYTRQRVNFEQVSTLAVSRYTEGVKSDIGSGVQAGSVQRIRDQFLDVQFRNETGKLGYQEQRAEAMNRMETIMNEPSEEGLSYTMDQFYKSLQDLSVNPESSGSRSVVSQRAQAVADTFNYISTSLEGVRMELNSQLDVTKKEFNSIITQINNVNQQIGGVEPHGHVPNDLYDERDRLIDRLSSIADISVEYKDSGGNPSPIAEGFVTITLEGVKDTAGNLSVTLVDGDSSEVKHMEVTSDATNNITSFTFSNPDETGAAVTTVNSIDYASMGELKGLMEMNGYKDTDADATDPATGYYNEMLDNLDKMATAFVTEFNKVHSEGSDLNGAKGVADFFELDTTLRSGDGMNVNTAITADPDLIAASATDASGDGENAIALAAVFDDLGVVDQTSVKSFYQSLIGDMGVVTQEAKRMVSNATVLSQQVQENRSSVSAVSLDEEMTNMIKFQHAYNAAARSMTVVDEMLDRIINNMGLVGR